VRVSLAGLEARLDIRALLPLMVADTFGSLSISILTNNFLCRRVATFTTDTASFQWSLIRSAWRMIRWLHSHVEHLIDTERRQTPFWDAPCLMKRPESASLKYSHFLPIRSSVLNCKSNRLPLSSIIMSWCGSAADTPHATSLSSHANMSRERYRLTGESAKTRRARKQW